MAKKINNEELSLENIGVNTPERDENMDEKTNGFYNEEEAEEELQENDQDDDFTDVQDEKQQVKAEEKVGFFKRLGRGVKKHWKLVLGIFGLIVVGGVVYTYRVGKKPVKLGTVEEVAKELGTSTAEVLDFAEETKKLAEDMVKNPENYEVANF